MECIFGLPPVSWQTTPKILWNLQSRIYVLFFFFFLNAWRPRTPGCPQDKDCLCLEGCNFWPYSRERGMWVKVKFVTSD